MQSRVLFVADPDGSLRFSDVFTLSDLLKRQVRISMPSPMPLRPTLAIRRSTAGSPDFTNYTPETAYRRGDCETSEPNTRRA
jgi:hypothetical protein